MKKGKVVPDRKQVNQVPKGYSDREKIDRVSKANNLY